MAANLQLFHYQLLLPVGGMVHDLHVDIKSEDWWLVFQIRDILGDPGAAGRDKGIFVGESLLQLL